MSSRRSLSEIIRAALKKALGLKRDEAPPPYPYDRTANAITLPSEVDHELFHLATKGGKAEAICRVAQLTGASQQRARDYVEALIRRR